MVCRGWPRRGPGLGLWRPPHRRQRWGWRGADRPSGGRRHQSAGETPVVAAARYGVSMHCASGRCHRPMMHSLINVWLAPHPALPSSPLPCCRTRRHTCSTTLRASRRLQTAQPCPPCCQHCRGRCCRLQTWRRRLSACGACVRACMHPCCAWRLLVAASQLDSAGLSVGAGWRAADKLMFTCGLAATA